MPLEAQSHLYVWLLFFCVRIYRLPILHFWFSFAVPAAQHSSISSSPWMKSSSQKVSGNCHFHVTSFHLLAPGFSRSKPFFTMPAEFIFLIHTPDSANLLLLPHDSKCLCVYLLRYSWQNLAITSRERHALF